MPDITLIEANGTAHRFEAPDGVSVMQAATGHGVPGIVAECGGSVRCATCHVVVADAWISQLPAPLVGPAIDGRSPPSRCFRPSAWTRPAPAAASKACSATA